MKCDHEVQHLIGKSDGIFCKNCHRLFVNFQEIENDRKSSNLTANPIEDGEAEEDIKKEKKTAVPEQSSTAKAAKTPRKKAVSKKKE